MSSFPSKGLQLLSELRNGTIANVVNADLSNCDLAEFPTEVSTMFALLIRIMHYVRFYAFRS